MKKMTVFLACCLWLAQGRMVFAQDQEMKFTPTPVQDKEIEKLKLEIEKQKLENQKLQLQLQLQGTRPDESGDKTEGNNGMPTETKPNPASLADKPAGEPVGKDPKRFALEISAQAEALAQKNASDEKMIVLDFTNGEIWYKGVRYPLSFINQLFEDQKWNVKPKFLKYSINGDSRYRYGYENYYTDRYDDDKIGVFVFKKSSQPGAFSFITPEGVTQDSTSGEVRNRFETAFYKFDNEHKDNKMKVLRFKHVHDFLSFDDVLEFWFDQSDKLVMVKWGLLDKQ